MKIKKLEDEPGFFTDQTGCPDGSAMMRLREKQKVTKYGDCCADVSATEEEAAKFDLAANQMLGSVGWDVQRKYNRIKRASNLTLKQKDDYVTGECVDPARNDRTYSQMATSERVHKWEDIIGKSFMMCKNDQVEIDKIDGGQEITRGVDDPFTAVSGNFCYPVEDEWISADEHHSR